MFCLNMENLKEQINNDCSKEKACTNQQIRNTCSNNDESDLDSDQDIDDLADESSTDAGDKYPARNLILKSMDSQNIGKTNEKKRNIARQVSHKKIYPSSETVFSSKDAVVRLDLLDYENEDEIENESRSESSLSDQMKERSSVQSNASLHTAIRNRRSKMQSRRILSHSEDNSSSAGVENLNSNESNRFPLVSSRQNLDTTTRRLIALPLTHLQLSRHELQRQGHHFQHCSSALASMEQPINDTSTCDSSQSSLINKNMQHIFNSIPSPLDDSEEDYSMIPLVFQRSKQLRDTDSDGNLTTEDNPFKNRRRFLNSASASMRASRSIAKRSARVLTTVAPVEKNKNTARTSHAPEELVNVCNDNDEDDESDTEPKYRLLPEHVEPFLSHLATGAASPIKSRKQHGSDTIPYNDIHFHEKIGAGSFGTVYRATLYGQDVAVKVVRLKDGMHMRDFTREVHILRAARHPNVIEYMGISEQPPDFCIITEYMSDGSLEDVMRKKAEKNKKLSLMRILSIAKDIATGLNWLHHKGVVHRDVKPVNVLIDPLGRAKLADFGLSHMKKQMDKPGLYPAVGTPSYTAPEVIMHKDYGVKADVFSFGVLLCELVAGKYPFDDAAAAASTRTFEKSIVTGMRPEIFTTNSQLRKLIEACWQNDPDARPTMAGVMSAISEIEQSLSDMTVTQHRIEELPDDIQVFIEKERARIDQLQKQIDQQAQELTEAHKALEARTEALEREHRIRTQQLELHRQSPVILNKKFSNNRTSGAREMASLSADLTNFQLLQEITSSFSSTQSYDKIATTMPGALRRARRYTAERSLVYDSLHQIGDEDALSPTIDEPPFQKTLKGHS